MTDNFDQNELLLQHATLFMHFDTDAALLATHQLVKVIRTWNKQIADQIDETRVGQHIDSDLGHESVYQDAASSHAIASALAPFIEGTLRHGFGHLQNDFDWKSNASDHKRWGFNEKDFWNLKKLPGKQESTPSIIDGSINLFDSLGCIDLVSKDFGTVGRALYVFRNNAFHNGFEWHPDLRLKFMQRCENEGWKDYFGWSKYGGELWIAGLQDSFVDQCLSLCNSLIKSFEEIRIRWTRAGWQHQVEVPGKPDWTKYIDYH